MVSGETESAFPSMLESLECARQSEQKELLANCLLWTGGWALTIKDLPLAWEYLQESLALFRELGDDWSQVLALNWAGYVADLRGDEGLAVGLMGQSLETARRQGDPWCLVVPLLTMAQRALAAGDMERAETTLLEVESVLRSVGDNWDLAWVLNGLGQVWLAREETATARTYLSQSLRLARENGNKVVMVFSLLEAAILMTARQKQSKGQAARERMFVMDTAARLCGATSALARDPTVLRRLGAKQVYESMLAQVRSAMEPDEWECGFVEGTGMPLDKTLDAAASELSPM